MSTFQALYYQLVWSTKYREPHISLAVESMLFRFLVGIAQNNRVYVMEINGTPDHIHLLIRGNTEMSVSKLVRDMKTSSTKMIRNNFPELAGFSWQPGFGVFSVSRSHVAAVQEYIKGQKEHHTTRSYKEEFLKLLERNNIAYDMKYVFEETPSLAEPVVSVSEEY